MIFWNYIVIALSLILLIVLLLWEIRRENRARLGGRIIATVLLVGSLAAIALPIGYTRGSMDGGKEGVLLTEGYSADSLRQFVNAKVWTATRQGMDIKGVSVLHVLGYGLTEEQLKALPNIPILFHPTPLQTGIHSLDWSGQILPGEFFRIQGSFYNAGSKPVKLLLFGLNTLLDSTEIKFQDEGDFELRTVPVQAGRAVYRLIALSGTDTLEQESIPVETLPVRNLKILMLAAAPDFENRFLANWLSDKGHGVVIRTAISKDKYDHAYLNMPAVGVEHLSAAGLGKFDVVIADASALKAMGPSDHASLWREVDEKGLGLVIKADSSSLGHGVRALGGGDSSLLRMVISDEPGQLPLVKDSLARTLVNMGMHGSGKVALTTLNTSYARLLAGEKKEYAALWTGILQRTARPGEVRERWRSSPVLAEVDQPVKLMLQYGGSSLPQGLLEEDSVRYAPISVYMFQHPLLPFQWEGLYWPRCAGWQSARTPQGERSWWYAWKEGDWKNLHRRERMQETQRWMASQRDHKYAGPEVGEAGRRVLIAKEWFCLLLVLSGLFLWVERKI